MNLSQNHRRVSLYLLWYGDMPSFLGVLFHIVYGVMGIIFIVFRHFTELYSFKNFCGIMGLLLKRILQMCGKYSKNFTSFLKFSPRCSSDLRHCVLEILKNLQNYGYNFSGKMARPCPVR